MRSLSYVSALLACVLLGGLGALTIANILDGPGTDRQEREAATPPIPTRLSELPGFLSGARFYATERYALKEEFITTNGIVKMGAFAHSPATTVMLGKDGYLFLDTPETIAGAQGQGRFDADDLARWTAHFSSTQQAFADAGLSYTFVIGPNKHSIYPEKTPDWLDVRPLDATRSADVVQAARTAFPNSFVDTRRLLADARVAAPDVALHHPTDTHWTEWGAAIALHAALLPLGFDLPAPQFEITDLVRSGDLARMVGQQSRWRAKAPVLPRGWTCEGPDGNAIDVVTIDPLMPNRFTCGTADGRPEKLVVFMDSFGISAIPYLAARFRSVDFLWTDAADPQVAVELGADHVLQILVERKMMTDTPESFLAQKAPLQ